MPRCEGVRQEVRANVAAGWAVLVNGTVTLFGHNGIGLVGEHAAIIGQPDQGRGRLVADRLGELHIGLAVLRIDPEWLPRGVAGDGIVEVQHVIAAD